ncbi:zinc finger protein 292-like isoform X1 [Chiloscyllium plagiosum]|uniref:zinc finger protein 292-like isoform X1 n=3 Tax=Chiloscyllium plagiosum TaxID=36176 RepID=UPI001CB85377|nr:zinc finger protein 292-like isoform X1 [Chiloscyllium plagiosum]
MADREVDADVKSLTDNLRELANELLELGVSVQSSGDYCQRFCQTLVQYAGKWKISDNPLPLLEVYTVAIQNYSKARPCLTAECENVCFVLDRLALSCTELLLCLPDEVPGTLWEQFQVCVQAAHKILSEYGNLELQMLSVLAQEGSIWKSSVLESIFFQQPMEQEKVSEFLMQEGPALLEMRIRHLLKGKQIDQATKLAKVCAEHPEIGKKSIFKQIYLTCLCTASSDILMEEISAVDCKDALEMICNLESDGEDNLALILCTAFLTRQLQQGDVYCAWELTLFWSKLQQRVESSTQTFLECCQQFSMLSKTVYHIFFLIKVIQSEAGEAGLSACIELCVRALRMESNESPTVKTSICKTVSCLLPDYLEVRRACQLTEFLLEPTVEAYYAVETLYNQPDQKYDDENGPIPNSLRCELLLVLKTHWPFDPEFWDWKTLKRHCLALMGEEASIVSSIDELNDSDLFENNDSHLEVAPKEHSLNGLPKFYSDVIKVQNTSSEEIKIKEKDKIEKGMVSARFKNWQAYMQYCVLCDREFLGHRIIRHAQTHIKEGNYYCPICAKSFKKKEIFVPHVTFHIKQSCKERLASIKPKRRVGRPPKNLTDISVPSKKILEIDKQDHRPIKRNSIYSEDFVVFSDSDGSDDEGKDKSYKPAIMITQKVDCTEDYNCPVTTCTKTFKYFKNLIAHVKGHGNEEEAKQFLKMQSNKVVCQYCRRRFVSVSHLNEHLQIHCGPKPYVCIQLECNASFGTYSELVGHRKVHALFKAKCMFQNCGRVFTESYLLYDHEAQHYHNSSYTCKFSNCGNIYYSQSELQKHEVGHVTQACVKIEAGSGSPFETKQLAPNRADQIDQLLKMKDEPCNQPDTYQNGFATDCVAGEIVESKSSMSEKLNALPSSRERCHLPKATYTGLTVKNEEINMDQTHCVLPKAMFKGEGTLISPLPEETEPGEVTKSVQMFSCKVDGCSRSYASSRSVSKHIKATHPEYYETLKKQQDLSKIQQIRNPSKCQNQESPPSSLCFSTEESLDITHESTLNTVCAMYQPITSVLTVESDHVSQSRKKKHTHNKRAKWPAIIKGDKFICSRCYREFTNPKSLGGHLSRRAICKPYDRKESSSVVEQKSGQALYKTEKVISPDAFVHQEPEPPCVTDTFLSGETFLQSLEMADHTAPFATHELFQPTQQNSYSSAFGPNKSPQVPGLPGTFETAVIQQTFQPNFEMRTVEGSPVNISMPQALTTICSPGSFVAGEDLSLSTEVPSMIDSTKGSRPYSPCEPLQQALESSFCSGATFVDNEIAPQNLESSCEPTIFFTNGILPSINSNHNSSLSEHSKTSDICIAELLLALQNLNLEYDKLYKNDASCPTSSSGTPISSMNIMTHTSMSNCVNTPNTINKCLTDTQTNTSVPAAENGKELKVNLIKPFICQEGGCIYSAMTKDALTNHYVKVHQYSKEQIMEMKMYQTRFAPFRCHVPNCQKTFTRNSNLRAHYQSMHQVTREQLVKLRIKRAYCRKSDGPHKAVDNVPSSQAIISQPRSDGLQENESSELHKLEPVTGHNEINSEINLHLHNSPNAKTVLYNHTMSQSSSMLLADLQDCSAIPAQLQNDLTQSVVQQDALVPAAGSQDTPMLLADPQDASVLTVESHSSLAQTAGLPAVAPLLAWPQDVLLQSVDPQNVSPVSEGLQDVSLLPTVEECVSPLPAIPQTALLPEVQGITQLVSGPANISLLSAGLQDVPILPLEPQGLSQPASDSADNSLLPAGSQGASPVPAGLQGMLPPVESQEDSVCEVRTKDPFLDYERPKDILLHPPDRSVQRRKCMGRLKQAKKAGSTVKFMKMSAGEKKCKKSITKIRTECNSNRFHKPYKCVHKDCSAAFTIQQNLILHYQAVHQSDQQHLHLQIKQETTKNAAVQMKEFQCQLNDCCRIFQGITNLIKHYSDIHNLTLDEMGKIVSSVSEGKLFRCDQADCVSSFTVFWSFIKHLMVAHGIDVESQQSDMDMTCFKCDCEGCDRTYATRSNLLRHIFTKHRELHRSHLMRPRRIMTDQENIPRTANQDDLPDEKSYFAPEENEDITNHGKSKPISRECFTTDSRSMKSGEVDCHKSCSSRKVAKYTFKSKAQALDICNKSVKEQYPCMFKNCSSVVTSERSLVKHYKIHHKISNTFVSQYHKHLVTCRKHASIQDKEATKYITNHEGGLVENAVSRVMIQPQAKLSETEILNKQIESDNYFKTANEISPLFNAKLIANTSACIKTEQEETVEMIAESKVTNVNKHQSCKKRSNSHLTLSDTEEHIENTKKKNAIMDNSENLLEDTIQIFDEKDASPSKHIPCIHKPHRHKPFDFSTFKPMGFEFSFLKFLEESALKQKKSAVSDKSLSHTCTLNTEKMADHGLVSSSVMLSDESNSSASYPVKDDRNSRVPVDRTKQSDADRLRMGTTNFESPLSLHILKNIKIIMDNSNSDCVELAEKQLQRMQPTVVLSRVKVDFNMLAQVKSVKERMAVKST